MPSPIEQFYKLSATIAHVEPGTERDDYGNVVTVTTETEVRCYLAQNSRTELGLDNIERDRWALTVPAGTALDANDVVRIGPAEYQVLGDPWPVVHPATGDVDHIEATLERHR